MPIPAGQYVVKIIVPPGYQLQKEEDKNVDFGDTYVPAAVLAERVPAGRRGGGPGEAQPAPTVEDNALIAPFCVGQLHLVPDDAVALPRPAAGRRSPARCGRSATRSSSTLRDGQQAAPDFHLFTEAPVAGHVYGMVLDDTTNEFDPNAPTFGEKYAVPFIGVSIRDWQGQRDHAHLHRPVRHVQRARADHLHDQPAGAERRVAEHPVGVHQPADDARARTGPRCRTRTSRSSTATSATRCSTCRGRRRTSTRRWCRPAPSPGNGTLPVDAELPEQDAGHRRGHRPGPERRPVHARGDLPERSA